MAAADASFNCNLWLLASILYLCEPATSQLCSCTELLRGDKEVEERRLCSEQAHLLCVSIPLLLPNSNYRVL
ncbi:hypothetical protein BKA62DRAFT_688768, partial [Auriculariales sp. MPI-PUGE-AT-0066]